MPDSTIHAGGIEWHVQVAGEGPALLLLHGTGSASFSWGDLLPALATHCRVIVPDLPGHGLTRAPSSALTLPGMALACDALLREIGMEPAIIVGHSAGVAVALELTRITRTKPRRIVGFNPALVPPPAAYRVLLAPLVNRVAGTDLVARIGASLADRHGIVDSLLKSTGSSISPEQRSRYQRMLQDPARVHQILTMMSGWSLDPLIAELPAITTPVALFCGRNDHWIPLAPLRRVVDRLPHATLELLDGGHLLHEEHPDTAARLIIELSQQHPR